MNCPYIFTMIATPSISSPSRPSYSTPDVASLKNRLVGRPWQSYEQGLKHLQRPKQAEGYFNKAIQSAKDKKDSALFANLMGVKLSERGLHQEALPFSQEAVRLDPNLAIAHNNLGNLLGELKRYEEAEREYRESIRLDPNDPAAHNNLGVLLIELKRYEEAEGEYREAIRLDPNLAIAHYNLGNLLKELRRYGEAEGECREAIRLDLNLVSAHNNLGVLLIELKRYGEAEGEYREAIRLDPNLAAAHNNLGLLLYSQERYKDSEKEYRKAIELEPNCGGAYINLAVLLCVTNHPEEARKEFKTALKLLREREPERLKEAVEYLEKELEVHCDNPSLWWAKGEFLKALGREAEAKKSLERAEFYEAIRYFEANKEGLLRQYEGKFVAILHDEVIDSDEDWEVLEERIIKRFGSRDLLVERVSREPEIIHIPTPFLVQ